MKGSGILKRLRLLKEDDRSKIKLFKTLLKELREPNIYLLERLVFFLSEDFLYGILKETKDIIKHGGCPTEDSTRLKTPGGTFFSLVKNKLPKEESKAIWNTKRKKKRKHKFDGNFQRSKEIIESEEEGILAEEEIITSDLCNMVII